MHTNGLIQAALSVSRFPKPDFTGGYDYPLMVLARAESFLFAYLDITVLVALMALCALAAYRLRSRTMFMAVSFAALLYFGILRKGCPCAVGSIYSVFSLFLTKDSLIDLPVLLYFILPMAAALFFGRLYCGGACPLGALQEFLFIRPLAFSLPSWLWSLLGSAALFYLGAAAACAWSGAPNIVCLTDPFVPVFHPGWLNGSGWFSFIVIFISLFLYRPYCRILCPYGVLQSLLARLSSKTPLISPDECVSCGLCEISCPADAVRTAQAPSDTAPVRTHAAALLALSCTGMLALSLFGNFLGSTLSALHPDVRLAAAFARGDNDCVEAVSFLEQSGNVDDLKNHASQIRGKLRTVMTISGTLAGLQLAAIFAMPLVRRRREKAKIAPSACYLCLRCIQACPREKLRRNPENKENT